MIPHREKETAIKIKDGFEGSYAVILPKTIVSELTNDNLTSSLYLTDIGYYPTAEHHYRKRENGSGQNIFIFCSEGKGWVESGGVTFSLSKGQYIIIPSGMPHSYWADDKNPWSIYWIHFNGTSAASFCKPAGRPSEMGNIKLTPPPEMIHVFNEIISILEQGYSKNNMNYVSSALHYLLGTIIFKSAKPRTEISCKESMMAKKQ